MLPMDPRRERFGKLLAWGGGLIAAALLAPFIFMSIKGMLGLVLALVLGLIMIHGAPWLAMKAANLGLKAVKAEARNNPIESLQNQTIQARERLEISRKELANFDSERRGFAQEVDSLRKVQPEDVGEFEKTMEQLDKLFAHKKAQIEKAESEVVQAEDATKRAARKWKVAQAANRMTALAGSAKAQAMNQIVADEAFDSVRKSMNQALSNMDAAIALKG